MNMKSLLSQIRNEWRANLFLLVELLLVFAVLWYVVDWVAVTARVYRAPMGFDTEHCYNLSFNLLTPQSALYNSELTAEDDIDAFLEIADRLRHRPGVESVTVSQNCFPYNEGSNSMRIYVQDTVGVTAWQIWSDPEYYRVFRYSAVDGIGAEKENGRNEDVYTSLVAGITDRSIVISSNVTDRYPELAMEDARPLLGHEVPLLYPDAERRFRIAAVGRPVRSNHFTTANQWGGAYIGVILNRDALVNELGSPRYVQISLRLHPEADHDFPEALMQDADHLYRVGNVYLLDVQSFDHLRRVNELEDVNEVRTNICILAFLLLNIFLGVIGTFWFRTQQRRREVALRMAMGSSRRSIFIRLMSEGILLLTVAAIPAAVIAANVGIAELVDVSKMPFTTGRFLLAALLAWLLMALMIIAGIWYPARKAMKLQPAEALHDE